jgi:hypothetical protein
MYIERSCDCEFSSTFLEAVRRSLKLSTCSKALGTLCLVCDTLSNSPSCCVAGGGLEPWIKIQQQQDFAQCCIPFCVSIKQRSDSAAVRCHRYRTVPLSERCFNVKWYQGTECQR